MCEYLSFRVKSSLASEFDVKLIFFQSNLLYLVKTQSTFSLLLYDHAAYTPTTYT